MGSTSPAMYVYLLVSSSGGGSFLRDRPCARHLRRDLYRRPSREAKAEASRMTVHCASGARGVGPGCVLWRLVFPFKAKTASWYWAPEQLQPFTDTEPLLNCPACRTSEFRSASSDSSPFQYWRALRTQAESCRLCLGTRFRNLLTCIHTLMWREYGMQQLRAGHHRAHLLLGLWSSTGPNKDDVLQGIQLSHFLLLEVLLRCQDAFPQAFPLGTPHSGNYSYRPSMILYLTNLI